MDLAVLDPILPMLMPYLDKAKEWLASPQFYAQVIAVVGIWILAKFLARQLLARVALLKAEPTEGRFLRYQRLLHSCRNLVEPLLFVVVLAAAAAVADSALGASWLIRIAQSLALVRLLHAVIMRFLANPVINAAARWIVLPIAAIYALGYYPQFIAALDGFAFEAGNIRVSVLALAKAAVFGGILFWLGRMSTSAGQRVIRDQATIDIQTRELAAKALEITVFAIVVLLLLNILGLDLTTLAVFGGALGVGIGFGLQQIASNFISGIILLLERSLKLGDMIELEDGRIGNLSQINMRSSVLATADGKEIMVPNERFISTSFQNWTHADPFQRYEVEFGVAYDSDLRLVQKLVEEAVKVHERVDSTNHEVEVVLRSFGDSAVNFAVEFWVSDLKGRDKFLSDVRFLVWEALKDGGVSMPFPQREVRIVGDGPLPKKKVSSS